MTKNQTPEERTVEGIRDAAKWLAGALGAIGAVIAAGVQLSSLGEASGARLAVALVGAALGFGGLLLALWATVRVLLPGPTTLSALRKEELAQRSAGGKWSGSVAYLRDNEELLRSFTSIDALAHDHGEYLKKYRKAYEKYNDPNSSTEDKQDARDDAENAQKMANKIAEVATSTLRFAAVGAVVERTATAMRLVLIGALATAAGLTTLAWASNPPDSSPPRLAGTDLSGAQLVRVDLAGADLQGANLTGANLRGAKLSGADLTGAVLTNADVIDADLDRVTWANTTCPDGTVQPQTCMGNLAQMGPEGTEEGTDNGAPEEEILEDDSEFPDFPEGPHGLPSLDPADAGSEPGPT